MVAADQFLMDRYGVPTFAAAPSGDVLVDAPSVDSEAAGGWPRAGVMAAVTMTPLSQGPSAHDQREALQLKTDDAKAGCAVKAGHCFGGRKGYFLYDLCGMANRSWIVEDTTTGWKEPYLVAPPGQLVDTSSCAACSGKRARAFQLYPSSVGGHEVAYCNASHADRCFALGTSSDQAAAPDASLINESDPSEGVTIQWQGGYAALQLNLTCCPSCGLDRGPVAVRESAGGSVYSFSWPTAAGCPKWVGAADCGFPPLAKPQPAQLKWIENEVKW